MKIGIIGSGNIGGNLGKHWIKAGHDLSTQDFHPRIHEGSALGGFADLKKLPVPTPPFG